MTGYELTSRDRERFEAKADRSGGPDACHPWTGGLDQCGYGRFWVDGHVERAHRVAWRLAGNEITEEKPHILHNCPGGDWPACVNEDHLWDGTAFDNQRDKARKGRGAKSKRGLPFGVRKLPSGRFGAQLTIDGKVTHLGTYDTAKQANAVAVETKQGLFKRLLTFPVTEAYNSSP